MCRVAFCAVQQLDCMYGPLASIMLSASPMVLHPAGGLLATHVNEFPEYGQSRAQVRPHRATKLYSPPSITRVCPSKSTCEPK